MLSVLDIMGGFDLDPMLQTTHTVEPNSRLTSANRIKILGEFGIYRPDLKSSPLVGDMFGAGAFGEVYDLLLPDQVGLAIKFVPVTFGHKTSNQLAHEKVGENMARQNHAHLLLKAAGLNDTTGAVGGYFAPQAHVAVEHRGEAGSTAMNVLVMDRVIGLPLEKFSEFMFKNNSKILDPTEKKFANAMIALVGKERVREIYFTHDSPRKYTDEYKQVIEILREVHQLDINRGLLDQGELDQLKLKNLMLSVEYRDGKPVPRVSPIDWARALT